MSNSPARILSELLAISSLHWQPIIDLSNGRCVGAEALLRPPVGTPAELLSWIDRKTQWEEFTRWEMNQVVTDLWLLPPLPTPFYAFFNLSPRQCVASSLLPWLSRFPVGIVPVIEILEESLETSHFTALAQARRQGFLLAVDDFGTGHSNIDRLLDLSVDFVKIDRKLVQSTGQVVRSLVKGVVKAIGNSNLRIVGEGLETEDHVHFAGKLGCLTGQGWFYGKPTPIRDLARRLLSN